MAEFFLPQVIQKNNEKTLIKGFGLPLVQRALIAANTLSIKTDKPDKTSYFGTPIYGSLFIVMPNYKEYEYNPIEKKYQETLGPVGLASNFFDGNNDGLLLDNVIIDVTKNRQIVTTDISGFNRGTVKEFINNGDYSINIRGFFATKNPDEAPLVDTGILASYCSAPVTLQITNTFLNRIFTVNNIVVTNLTMSQQVGLRNVQYFEISALSDNPFDLKQQDEQANQ
jgi:hypothetical protein